MSDESNTVAAPVWVPTTQYSGLSTHHSYSACRSITRQAKSSFPVAFRLLSPHKRRAMDALYAFMRVTDDFADEPGELPQKQVSLASWRAGLAAAIEGRFSHPIHPALADTIEQFEIPTQYLFDVIDGVESDLVPRRFATFSELYPYCYRVASAVGQACVRVWGLRPSATWDDANAPAEAAGIAFQITNILRDLGEDLARGRVYLPADELVAFGSPPESWGEKPDAFQAMLHFQVSRAREFYRKTEPLCG
ncbi:MAG TPA: phytoene/squalene synthase family protein, partial [Gemmata sp.]|nr:phytoene/squalene synthase family protein [Gemmata sp.]